MTNATCPTVRAWPCACHVALPRRSGGRWEFVPYDQCEDVEGLNEGALVHIPCGRCGPFCQGPDCFCREETGS